jgi:hypothetical protein
MTNKMEVARLAIFKVSQRAEMSSGVNSVSINQPDLI